MGENNESLEVLYPLAIIVEYYECVRSCFQTKHPAGCHSEVQAAKARTLHTHYIAEHHLFVACHVLQPGEEPLYPNSPKWTIQTTRTTTQMK